MVYGHTPVPEAEFINNTLCIDTGCVFGGKLTALRYPENARQRLERLPTHQQQRITLMHGSLLYRHSAMGRKVLVLVLEQHYTAGGLTHSYARNGYEWDVGVHYIGDMGHHGLPRRLFDFLSAEQLHWAPMDDNYDRIILGDEQFNFIAGKEPFKAELKKHFPAEHAAIDRYVDLILQAQKQISFPSAKNPDYLRRNPGTATVEIVVPCPYSWVQTWQNAGSENIRTTDEKHHDGFIQTIFSTDPAKGNHMTRLVITLWMAITMISTPTLARELVRPHQMTTDQLVGYASLSPARRKIIATALQFGRDHGWLKYCMGGHSVRQGCLDCSGAVELILIKAGYSSAPRTSYQQFMWVKQSGHLTPIPNHPVVHSDPVFKNLKPGDLLFWTGTYGPTDHREIPISHVQIYLGRDKQGRYLMVGSSKGRSYRGQPQDGYGVFDFNLPRKNSKARFVGYGLPEKILP